MIPSNKWFPSTIQDRSAWFNNFINVFTALAPGLGFTVAELTQLQDDQQDYASLAQSQEALDNFNSAFRQFRISLTEDPVGTPAPTFPAITFTATPNGVPAGMFQRLIEAVDRIRAHPTYTDEMGANLGIKPATSAPTPEAALKPVLKATAQPGNVVEAKFSRGESDGIVIEYQVDIETNWTVAGNFFKSPALVPIEAKENNLPRAVRMRARYLKGNDAVGQNSDTVSVTTNP
jgi:hypothetical protein